MNNFQINTESNQFTFTDQRYYQREDGSFVPSVTTVLDAYPKGPQYFEWLKKHGEHSDEIMNEAGDKGSVVHHLTERYDLGQEVTFIVDGEIGYKSFEWACLEKWIDFRNRFTPEIHNVELRAVGARYAGTIDRVITFRGRRYVLDLKSGNNIYPHHWLQASAYRNLLVECHGIETDGVAIIHLNSLHRTLGKGNAVQGMGWQLIIRDEEDLPRDERLFQYTHQLWLAEFGNNKPRQATHQLSHKLSQQ